VLQQLTDACRAAEAFTRHAPVPKSNPTSKPAVKGSSISIAVIPRMELIFSGDMDRGPPMNSKIKEASAAT
jgi:hypothetical protein